MSTERCAGEGQAGDGAAGFDHRRIIEASPDGIWLLGLDGRIDYANSRARAFMPAEGEAGWSELWPPNSRLAADRALRSALAGEARRFRSFLPDSGAGQAHVYLDTEVSPLRDRAGRVTHVLATARDVTHEVEADAFLHNVVQLLPLSLTVKDVRSGRYVLFNRSAEDLYGASADDAIGMTAAEVFAPDMARAIAEADERAVASFEARRSFEMTVPTEGGGTRHIATRRSVTHDDSGPRHVLTLSEDVTDQRAGAEALRAALRSAEQASRAKSAFLANMSHEIRTPLNGIIAAVEMLARDDLADRPRRLVELIGASGEALHRLLSDVLDIARHEAGAIALEPAAFHIGDLVRELSALFGLEAERRGLALSLTVAPEADRGLVGDRFRIGQIVSNLLDNAIKFTERGAVGLALEAAGGGRVRITVTDSGIGFDPGQKALIFDRFQQTDSSATRRFGGSGLGLALCRALGELMGARLDCDSEPGRGSRFWFELDLPAADVPVAETADSEPPDGLSILVAEDHAANRAVLDLMLGSLAELCMVENGALAAQAVRSRRFDLVLMDMQMPEMDGLAATRAIRAYEEAVGQEPTPIIMLTANTGPEHVAASLAAGANLHLAKPVTPSALYGAVDQVLSPAEAE
jgi:two-component system, sensor histidine kinase